MPLRGLGRGLAGALISRVPSSVFALIQNVLDGKANDESNDDTSCHCVFVVVKKNEIDHKQGRAHSDGYVRVLELVSHALRQNASPRYQALSLRERQFRRYSPNDDPSVERLKRDETGRRGRRVLTPQGTLHPLR